MKKVGIIDNYISNFHANTYYKLFHEITEEEKSEEYVITNIYACLDLSPTTGETTAQWCERTGAVAMNSVEDVCEAVDVIMILAPNHPHLHENYCKIAFSYGKPVYVDKTFAPNFATAKRIIDFGKENNTSFWSSSATRFEPELDEYLRNESHDIQTVSISSGNSFEIYSIHLVELMNTFIRSGAESVICHNNTANLVFQVNFENGKKAFINQACGTGGDFTCCPEIDGKCKKIVCKNDFWKGFCRALLRFFENGEIPVSPENTLECIAVLDAMKKAIKYPNCEIKVEM